MLKELRERKEAAKRQGLAATDFDVMNDQPVGRIYVSFDFAYPNFVRHIPAQPCKIGQRVRVVGLSSAAGLAMNEREGIVIEAFDYNKRRFGANYKPAWNEKMELGYRLQFRRVNADFHLTLGGEQGELTEEQAVKLLQASGHIAAAEEKQNFEYFNMHESKVSTLTATEVAEQRIFHKFHGPAVK